MFKIASIVVCSIFLMQSLGAQEVVLQSLTATQEVLSPGTVTSLRVRVENRSTDSLSLSETLELPVGWRVVAGANDFTLLPGGTTLRILGILPPVGAYPGVHRIRYRLQTPDGTEQEVSFALTIRERIEAKLMFGSIPRLFPADTDGATTTVRVHNLSNGPQRFELEGHHCELPFSRLLLEPGADTLLRVRLHIPSDVTRDTRITYRIRATSVKSLEHFYAFAETTVLPSRTGKPPALRTFDGTLRTFAGLQRHSGRLRRTRQVEYTGGGFLDVAQQHQLNLKARTNDGVGITAYSRPSEYFAQYRLKDQLEVSLGDRIYVLSPLTEFGRFGRGAEVRYTIGDYQLGALAMRPRFQWEIESESGVFVQHHLPDNGYLRGIALTQTRPEPRRRSQILSLGGRRKVSPHLDVEAELAIGNENRRSTVAGYFDLRYDPGPRLDLQARTILSAPGFPGFYTNARNHSGQATYRLGKKWLATASTFQLTRPPQRDTFEVVSPATRRAAAGLTFLPRSGTRFTVRLRSGTTEDQLPVARFHRRIRTVQFRGQHRWSAGFVGANIEAGEKLDLLTPELSPENIVRAELETGWQPTRRWSFRATAQFLERSELIGTRGNVLFGGSVRHRFGEQNQVRIFYQSAYRLEEYYRDRTILSTVYQQQIGRRHRLNLRGDYMLRRATLNERDFNVFLEYSYQLHLPLERNPARGEVRGILVDAQQRPLANKRVLLNDRSVLTGPDGSFVFRYLPAGGYWLSLGENALAPTETTLEPLPLRFESDGDSTHFYELRVVETAVINGRIDLVRAEQPAGTTTPATRQPVLLELRRGEEVLRTYLEPNGTFRFPGLRPGAWEVKVHTHTLPKNYRMDQSLRTLDLRPGDARTVTFRAVEQRPRLRMQQKMNIGF